MMAPFSPEGALPRQLAAVLDETVDGFVLVDGVGHIVGWNDAVVALTGLSSAAIASGTLDVIDQCLMPARAGSREPLLERLHDPSEPRLVMAADGRLYERAVQPLALASTQLGYLVSFRMRDGMPGSSAASAPDAMSDEQRRHALRMESVGRLAGGIAHDFNNMLTAMMGYAELLEREIGPRESLRQVMHAARSAADLTRQLLAFSRQQRLEPRVVDVASVVASLGGMVGRLIGDDVQLDLDAPSGLPNVCIDPTQLEQIVMNLAINARDAMTSGGQLAIRVRHHVVERPRPGREVEPAGEYVQVIVEDTGNGIAPELLPRVFEPFFTTKGLQGTGLGLSTVYGIVKQSGGFIWVESELGSGTTFTIDLPVTSQPEQVPLAFDPPSVSTPASGCRVLVVEDQESVRLLTCEMLESDGFSVVSAADPRDGVALALDPVQRVDLVLTDVTMPGMTGAELAQAIRTSRPEMPVIFMSGMPKALAGDAPGPILAKPFSRTSLLEHVRSRLAVRA